MHAFRWLLTLVLATAVTACDSGGDNDDDLVPPPSDEVVYGETTVARAARVLAPADSAEVLAVSQDGEVVLRASAFGADTLAAGEVLVAGPSAAAPDGLLRRVERVERDGHRLRLRTSPATLSDVIIEGRAQGSLTFGPDDVAETVYLAPGVTETAPAARADERRRLTFEYELNDVVLFDIDGNPSTMYDRFTVNGALSLTPSFDFDWVWTRLANGPESAYVEFQITSETDLDVRTEVELGQVDAEIELAVYRLTPIVVPVGASPVPIVLTPLVRLVLDVDGTLRGGIVAEMGYATVANRFVEWSADAPLQRGGTVRSERTYATLRPSVEVAAEVSVRSPVEVLVYGLAGPNAFVKASASLSVDPFANPWWAVDLSTGAGAGLRLTVFGRDLVDVETDVFLGPTLRIADAGGPLNLPLPPRISDPRSRLVGGPGCDEGFGRWEMSLAYRDPNGDVTEGSYVTDEWAFEGGASGTLTAVPVLSGDGAEGRATFWLCTRFGSSPSITDRVRLVDGSGRVSAELEFYRQRPPTAAAVSGSAGQSAASAVPTL